MLQGKERPLMLIKYVVLFGVGLAGGAVIAAGIFAFITMIGVFPRLASRTNTAAYIYYFETAIIAGGTLGNILTLFHPSIPAFGVAGLFLMGLFSGIYTGCLAMALAENLKVIPVLVKRVKLKQGLPWVIAALALGKAMGSFYQFYMG